MPDSVVQAATDYQIFSDKMGQFFDECIEEKEGCELRRGAVYTRYKKSGVERMATGQRQPRI